MSPQPPTGSRQTSSDKSSSSKKSSSSNKPAISNKSARSTQPTTQPTTKPTSQSTTKPTSQSTTQSGTQPKHPFESSASAGKLRRPPAAHLALGAEGEARAELYLKAKGYRIIARNVRAGGVELDLVVRHRRTLVFVEVKTRRSRRFGPPELAVDAGKQARLVTGARAWLREHGRGVERARIDVVAWQVEARSGEPDQWRLRHFENAFEADEPPRGRRRLW